jgi:hypothetical protein
MIGCLFVIGFSVTAETETLMGWCRKRSITNTFCNKCGHFLNDFLFNRLLFRQVIDWHRHWPLGIHQQRVNEWTV